MRSCFVAFADFITEGHRETWPIRSKRFRTWLRRCYYHATGSAPSAAAIRSALDLLEARAQFDGPERAVNTRVAEHAGLLYLDLADEHWRAVAIGPDGWRVLGCPPVRFRRAPGMLPLPVPERGGSIEALQSFLNLSNQNDFVLVVAWLLAALRSSGPYPLLAISLEWDRGYHWPLRFGRPRDFADLGADWRGTASFRDRALAGIRTCEARDPWGPA